MLLNAAACVCGRTILETIFESMYDLGLSERLLIELDAVVCASRVCVNVVTSGAVAIVCNV